MAMALSSSANGEDIALADTSKLSDALTGEIVQSASASPLDGEEIGSGMASWYGPKFAGRRTASGEVFDPSELTAAHRTLPFGSRVLVTNEESGQSVIVRINDRGPWSGGRVIDVSQAAARQIGLIGPGHGEVSLTLLDG
ncbi:septal ring lytic transglycosylase RlpA family protein [Croceicoccus estronivorus]|uniref:septal ring lytic transglycosylase RlpA family protein n=1 Tax=Croceicoccus estronivorus TaxID=1172626 RepID=UPI00147866A0|nr:septal ring lytic transglycosylase RlpA family protein [Croceicoccus estronivorus]